MDGMVTTLQEKAEIDKLSGVMNKGAFQEMSEQRLAEAAENRIAVFVMLDVDNFKQVNDKLGHVYGDQVIIRIGQLLRRLYDQETLIGRLGGDEFALLTLCTDVDQQEVIRAVREQMEMTMEEFQREFEIEREKCDISISAGVYVTEEEKPEFSELYEKTDAVLYESKHKGKARYTLHTRSKQKGGSGKN